MDRCRLPGDEPAAGLHRPTRFRDRRSRPDKLEVGIAGRIWQEAERRPFRAAIRYAVPRASGTIAIAGLTLAGSFALLALIPIQPMRELAFVMAVGILVDSFLVRSILVPSLAASFGRVSWWPNSPPQPEALPRTGD